ARSRTRRGCGTRGRDAALSFPPSPTRELTPTGRRSPARGTSVPSTSVPFHLRRQTMKFSIKLRTVAAAACALAMLPVAHADGPFPERSVRASLVLAKDHSLGKGLTHFAQCTAEKTGGKFKVQT